MTGVHPLSSRTRAELCSKFSKFKHYYSRLYGQVNKMPPKKKQLRVNGLCQWCSKPIKPTIEAVQAHISEDHRTATVCCINRPHLRPACTANTTLCSLLKASEFIATWLAAQPTPGPVVAAPAPVPASKEGCTVFDIPAPAVLPAPAVRTPSPAATRADPRSPQRQTTPTPTPTPTPTSIATPNPTPIPTPTTFATPTPTPTPTPTFTHER